MVESAGKYSTTVYNFSVDASKPPPPDEEFDEQVRLMSEEKRAAAPEIEAPSSKKPKKTRKTSEASMERKTKKAAPEADPDRKGSDTRSSVLKQQLAPSAPAPYMNYVVYNICKILSQEYRNFAAASAVLETAAGLSPKNKDHLGDAIELKHVPVSGCPKEFFKASLRPLLVQYFSEMPAHARSSGGTHNTAADYYAAHKRVVEGSCAGDYTPLEQQEFDSLKALDREFCSVGRTDATFGRKDRVKKVKNKAEEDAQKDALFRLQESVANGTFRKELLDKSIPEQIKAFVGETFAGNEALGGLAEFILSADREMVHNILTTVEEEARDAANREESAKAKAAFREKKGKPPKADGGKHKRAARPDVVYVPPQEVAT